uniref:NADH-ubiquinone oxidoreductase chain 4 n=1 Tax=Tropiocolotes steudneri TaxID=401551 RepID=A0A0A1HAL9_9SAUR|nr:NADH dehydrogenase subunit 4 [Tropiocolotes steudneri]
MLKALVPTALLFPTILALPHKLLYPAATAYSTLISAYTLKLLYSPLNLKPQTISPLTMTDKISTPLLILSSWLLPMMIIASQHALNHEPMIRKRTFIATAAMLQTALMMTFIAPDMTMFYIMFEATLVPTLFMITRWGAQAERLNAGTYFLFYTLTGSLPLLIAILTLLSKTNHTNFVLLTMKQQPLEPSYTNNMMWLACMLAFLVKMPLYGTHLWLPKAHVEAPIAGSMILAAVLLKLGGYGIIRLMPTVTNITQTLYHPFIVLALWGMIMTSMICLRQTDLKSIIAYSSVSHMGLVIAGTLIQTPWGTKGAMILMIAHGLTSSMLFCLANTNYERTHTRTLILTRGLQLALPLMTSWWMAASLTNLALPPTINLLGEIMIITSIFNWNTITIALTAMATVLTATYSLHIFLTTQRHKLSTRTPLKPTHTREHLLMTLHLAPLMLLILHPNLML